MSDKKEENLKLAVKPDSKPNQKKPPVVKPTEKISPEEAFLKTKNIADLNSKESYKKVALFRGSKGENRNYLFYYYNKIPIVNFNLEGDEVKEAIVDGEVWLRIPEWKVVPVDKGDGEVGMKRVLQPFFRSYLVIGELTFSGGLLKSFMLKDRTAYVKDGVIIYLFITSPVILDPNTGIPASVFLDEKQGYTNLA